MTLAEYRSKRGLTLERAAEELSLSPKSASWLCEIEGGKRHASLRLALRIERWSDGEVAASSMCPELMAA